MVQLPYCKHDTDFHNVEILTVELLLVTVTEISLQRTLEVPAGHLKRDFPTISIVSALLFHLVLNKHLTFCLKRFGNQPTRHEALQLFA